MQLRDSIWNKILMLVFSYQPTMKYALPVIVNMYWESITSRAYTHAARVDENWRNALEVLVVSKLKAPKSELFFTYLHNETDHTTRQHYSSDV